MISRLRYTFREMWASLSRNLTLTVAAVITSTVSLFLFGGSLLIQRAFDGTAGAAGADPSPVAKTGSTGEPASALTVSSFMV